MFALFIHRKPLTMDERSVEVQVVWRLRVTFGVTRITIVDLTLLASTSLRLSFACVAVSGTFAAAPLRTARALCSFGSGHIAMTTFLTQLLLAQIVLTFCKQNRRPTGSSNCKRSCDLNRPWPGACARDICLADIYPEDGTTSVHYTYAP